MPNFCTKDSAIRWSSFSKQLSPFLSPLHPSARRCDSGDRRVAVFECIRLYSFLISVIIHSNVCDRSENTEIGWEVLKTQSVSLMASRLYLFFSFPLIEVNYPACGSVRSLYQQMSKEAVRHLWSISCYSVMGIFHFRWGSFILDGDLSTYINK